MTWDVEKCYLKKKRRDLHRIKEVKMQALLAQVNGKGFSEKYLLFMISCDLEGCVFYFTKEHEASNVMNMGFPFICLA